MSTAAQFPDEFSVRVPELSNDQSISILKFGSSVSVDVTKWDQVTMDREDNADVYGDDDSAMPKYGSGSEYGKKLRIDARRKKLGYRSHEYRRCDQPWLLSQNDGAVSRKFRGVREGGVTEHADYWVFVKTKDNVFSAYPVAEWYNFMAVSKHKTLDIDEAEEQYKMRATVLNQFALKSSMKVTAADSDDGQQQSQADATTSVDAVVKSIAKKALLKKRKEELMKAKKKRDKDDDGEKLVASADSDDGDEEGREIDYMSDSASDDDDENGEKEERLIGVDEEAGMRKFIGSDNEDDEDSNGSEDDDDEEEPTAESAAKTSANDFSASSSSKFADDEPESDSDSDTDDPDNEAVKSAFLLQKKQDVTVGKTASTSEPSSLKRSPADMAAMEGSGATLPPKRQKSEVSVDSRYEITEEEVLRYLQRKPMTCQELVSKFRSRCNRMPKQQVVQRMAHILRKLKPVQFKRNNTLYFSLSTRRT